MGSRGAIVPDCGRSSFRLGIHRTRNNPYLRKFRKNPQSRGRLTELPIQPSFTIRLLADSSSREPAEEKAHDCAADASAGNEHAFAGVEIDYRAQHRRDGKQKSQRR